MALMKYREPNMVKWVGARPGHNGTQVLVSGAAVGAQVLTYQVTLGKTLFLVSTSLEVRLAAVGSATLELANDGGIFQYLLEDLELITVVGFIPLQAHLYTPPIECPSQWQFFMTSSAGLNVRGGIFGWEE